MKKKFFSSFFSFIKKKKKTILEKKNNFIKENKKSNSILDNNILLENLDEKLSNESNILSNKSLTNSVKDVFQKSSCDYDNYNLNKEKIKDKKNISDIKITKDILDLGKKSFLYKNNFIKNLKEKLKKTRDYFGAEIKNIFFKNNVDAVLFDTLEEKLLSSDVGFKTTNMIIDNLKSMVIRNKLKKSQEIYDLLKDQMRNILTVVEKPIKFKCNFPFVILVVGVNGVGKTTTIGKLAAQYKKIGKSVMLAAGDTFRAAAIEQLKEWGLRNNISVIAQKKNSDPASVVFDAMKSAQAKKIDILIVDTAGRLHNKIPLMNELKKIKMVMNKLDILAPHEIILIVDACSGQNTLQQTKLFHELLHVTGIIITKLDGTAKGGIVFSIAHEFSIPIYYISIGENITDLKVFNTREFIESIF